jgi:predicted esterase
MLHSENITVFAHGIIDDASQSQRFQKVITTSQLIAPNFADALIPSGINFNNFLHTLCLHFGKKVNRNAMFMGQKNDINVIQSTIDKIKANYNIILYGCSRGAATAVTYLGVHNPNNIAALVLDACPANIPDNIQMKLAQSGINPFYSNAIFSYIFPQYDIASAIPPLQAIQNIKNKKLPILLIHSLEDKNVHYTNSLKLYTAFVNAGFTNVHLCLLKQGKHSFLLQDDRIANIYTATVHSFYKKYNLPYNQEIKTFNLESNSVNLEEIKNQIKKYEAEIILAYENAQKNNLYYSATTITLAITYWYLKNNSLQ